MSFVDTVKTDAALDGEGAAFAAALAAAKVDQLIGVTAAAAKALAKIGVTTVFDLAHAHTFDVATDITTAAGDTNHPLSRAQRVPDAWVVAALAGSAPDTVAASPAESLVGVDGLLSHAELVGSLGVATVADFAHWPAYAAARGLVAAALGIQSGVEGQDRSGTPPDLLPANGVYPTEIMYYERLFLDSFIRAPSAPRKDLTKAGPLSIADAAAKTTGFDTPALGALVTISQSWNVLGSALGQLLHSLALAPGESVRIAMVDWQRSTTGKRDETGNETENLDNTTVHDRAITEVANVVANERQTGSGTAIGAATTEQGGLSGGAGPVGGTYSRGSNTTFANTWSTSDGHRDINADTTQDIEEKTTQAASAVRSRRASVVQEVQESEASTATTRVVANYNHMHAMTVQYFEIVQVFSVRTQVAHVSRCLFVPIALEDFDDLPTGRNAAIVAGVTGDPELRRWMELAAGGIPLIYPTPPAPDGGDIDPSPEMWDDPLTRAATDLASSIPGVRSNPNELTVPAAASIVEIAAPSLRSGDVFTIERRDGTRANATVRGGRARFSRAIPIGDLRHLTLSSTSTNPVGAVDIVIDDGIGNLGLLRNRSGRSADTATAAGPLLVAREPLSSSERNTALARLKSDRLRYNQALWAAMDTATLALLLADYDFERRSVMEQVDPAPIGLVGNYLVFKMNTQPDDAYTKTTPPQPPSTPEESWHEWLHDHSLDTPVPTSQLVALPSAGVFAEAVLGRSNSAELLDLTRFWNWQDSPIPLQPTEILPPSTDSRGGVIDLTPGQFPNPMVNIVAPTTLPDPSGMSGILSAVARGDMFRNMSGLDLAADLAGAALTASSAAAASAGTISAENYAEMNRHKEAIFDRFLQLYGKGGGGSAAAAPANRNISTAGAAINHGRRMDNSATDGAGDYPTATNGDGAYPGTNGSGAPSGSAEGEAFSQAIGNGFGGTSSGSGLGAMGYFGNIVGTTMTGGWLPQIRWPAAAAVPRLLKAAREQKPPLAPPLTELGANAIYAALEDDEYTVLVIDKDGLKTQKEKDDLVKKQAAILLVVANRLIAAASTPKPVKDQLKAVKKKALEPQVDGATPHDGGTP